MQGRHYSVRDSRRCVHLCLVWITYIFFEFWWIGRKMTGRWAGWVPSWRLCLRATKNTRWAAAETAEAKKNIMTEWNNRVMISLDKKWTAITIYWLSDTFQQIQLILFSFFFLKYFPFSNFCANLIKISTSYPISILTDCYLWILCFNLFDGFYFSSSRKMCLRVSRQSYATRLVSFLLSLISFQCVSFSLPELFGSSSFSFCLCFFASLFSPLLEREEGRMNDNISHLYPLFIIVIYLRQTTTNSLYLLVLLFRLILTVFVDRPIIFFLFLFARVFLWLNSSLLLCDLTTSFHKKTVDSLKRPLSISLYTTT